MLSLSVEETSINADISHCTATRRQPNRACLSLVLVLTLVFEDQGPENYGKVYAGER